MQPPQITAEGRYHRGLSTFPRLRGKSDCTPAADAWAVQGADVFVDTPKCAKANDPGCTASDFQTNNRLKASWADYDAAGNLTHFKFPGNAAFDWTAGYDGENKQRHFCANQTAACGAANATAAYRYDGQGHRVEKTSGGETTVYVYDAFGKLAAEYSTAGPAADAGGTFFRTTDHLGSTRLVTDANGQAYSRRDFFPFGEQIPANGSFGGRDEVAGYGGSDGFSQRFTGKERDEESGLDYFGYRYLSSVIGRFTSADSPFADQFAADPQSWNMYAYVRNRPLVLIDPFGRCSKKAGSDTATDDPDEPCVEEEDTVVTVTAEQGNPVDYVWARSYAVWRERQAQKARAQQDRKLGKEQREVLSESGNRAAVIFPCEASVTVGEQGAFGSRALNFGVNSEGEGSFRFLAGTPSLATQLGPTSISASGAFVTGTDNPLGFVGSVSASQRVGIGSAGGGATVSAAGKLTVSANGTVGDTNVFALKGSVNVQLPLASGCKQ